MKTFTLSAVALAALIGFSGAALAQNRATMPLFNTELYTRHLENAYLAMHQRHQSGLLPEPIYVPE